MGVNTVSLRYATYEKCGLQLKFAGNKPALSSLRQWTGSEGITSNSGVIVRRLWGSRVAFVL